MAEWPIATVLKVFKKYHLMHYLILKNKVKVYWLVSVGRPFVGSDAYFPYNFCTNLMPNVLGLT